ncbi:T9SS type A sorting domain-containing protein [Robertkochia marina]|uniref:T9SS type A sorting domain-containing protein n=1 Tax=Robertkochia marina TaxID=1227945 RepID=A0A4S3LZC9_9FLAO|nr:T9SS type A sorting domain-containing protein [Robertkochia marina]THD67462.1 T9SS type A sorting domain-containing protein [Robertkochia marina]TRZ44669.1 T9SS C-terminal target domain-containing protein [Robertkochia marina]
MVLKLLLFVCLFSSGFLYAQQPPKGVDHKGDEPVAMWKTVKPEKLESSELMLLPSNRYLRLNLKEDLGFTKVIIQDLNGITLMEFPFDPGRDMDISELKPGNYFIKVISANKVLQGKFGKRRL